MSRIAIAYVLASVALVGCAGARPRSPRPIDSVIVDLVRRSTLVVLARAEPAANEAVELHVIRAYKGAAPAILPLDPPPLRGLRRGGVETALQRGDARS